MAENTTYQLRSSNGNTSDVLNNLAENGIPAFTTFEVFPRFTKVEAGTPSTSKVNFEAMFGGTNQWNKTKTYAQGVYVTIYNAEQPLESKIYKTLKSVPSSIDITNTAYWQDETSTFFTISGDNAYHNYIQEIPSGYTHAIYIKSAFDPAHQNVTIDWGDGTSVALSDAVEFHDALRRDNLTADTDQYLSAVVGRHADGSFDVIYAIPEVEAGPAYGTNECYKYYCYHDYMPAMVEDGIIKLTVTDETVTATQVLPDQPYRVLIYGTTFYGLACDGGTYLQYYIDPVKDYNITTRKFKTDGNRSTKYRFSNVLLSRIFDTDLPFFPHANITLASLANRAKNLLYINIPKYFDAFNNVINTYEMFERCSNLQYCNGFSNKLRFKSIRGMCRMFNCCENLLKCDIKLAKYVIDHNINSVHDGNKEVFSFCSKLAVDVMSLLPLDGFSARYMNVTGAFSRCNSLDIADKYIDRFKRILWKDITKVWKTHADYNENNKDIAGNLDIGAIQIKDSPMFYKCNQLIQKKIDSNNSIIPDSWKNLLPYIDPDIIYITIPTLTDIAYNGFEHSVTVPTHAGYTIDETNSTLYATDAGNYKVILILNEGYVWSDGSTEDQEIEWSITQAENGWKDGIKPAISKSSWYENEDPGVLTTGVAKFGDVKVTLNNDEYDIKNPLPTELGNYTIKFVVEENNNYTELSETITFSILEVEELLTFDDIKLDLEYGEVKTGLGENEDEVAVIFTNSDVDNIQWTVPGTISAEFLAVGGGGGGGGAAAYDKKLEYINRGGAGGGGGGVVTGYINVLSKDSVLNIKIGAGGAGGPMEASMLSGSGAATMGGSTTLYVNDVFYLSACGGGRDLGRGRYGGIGGSNAGSRISTISESLTWKNTAINKNVIKNSEIYGNVGGAAPNAISAGSARASGGGGGATEAGGNSNGNKGTISNTDENNKIIIYGGKGGEGLSSNITGIMTVYGSGGGGGSGYRGGGNVGGTGAGKGGDAFNSTDTVEDERIGGNALPNQGGGGGGAGNNRKGGNGGSGIFVLRFKVNKQEEPDTPDTPNEPINPLTFTSTGNTTIKLKKVGEPDPISLTYQIDDNEPQNYEINQQISLANGQKLKLYATSKNTTISKDANNYYQFSMIGSIAASGNINTLLKVDGSILDLTADDIDRTYCFYKMFSNCTSLTSAPELPAMTLANWCYSYMFQYCTSLTNAPELLAMTLASHCYDHMFSNCTSLSQAPELPAETLADSCYQYMFSNCTSLTSAPELPAETLADSCYKSMFVVCTSLSQAPELPAMSLTESCYSYMFYDCTNLSSINVSFTDWNNRLSATTNWVKGVASMGTFTCSEGLPKEYDNSHIPEGWTTNKPINPLTFTSTGNTTIKLKKVGEPDPISLTYQIDDNEPQNYEFGTTINLSDGQSLKMYATTENINISKNIENYYEFDMDRSNLESYITVSGHINTLLKADGSINDLTGKDYCFVKLFYQCAAIFYTHNLKLPATTLANNCYQSMFQYCTNLIYAPELPATQLTDGCYAGMFVGCFSLVQAPELPATNLVSGCYEYMFNMCESLSSVTAYFENWNENTDCTDHWLDDTAPNGILKCLKSNLIDGDIPRNVNTLPATWTIETID